MVRKKKLSQIPRVTLLGHLLPLNQTVEDRKPHPELNITFRVYKPLRNLSRFEGKRDYISIGSRNAEWKLIVESEPQQ